MKRLAMVGFTGLACIVASALCAGPEGEREVPGARTSANVLGWPSVFGPPRHEVDLGYVMRGTPLGNPPAALFETVRPTGPRCRYRFLDTPQGAPGGIYEAGSIVMNAPYPVFRSPGVIGREVTITQEELQGRLDEPGYGFGYDQPQVLTQAAEESDGAE